MNFCWGTYIEQPKEKGSDCKDFMPLHLPSHHKSCSSFISPFSLICFQKLFFHRDSPLSSFQIFMWCIYFRDASPNHLALVAYLQVFTADCTSRKRDHNLAGKLTMFYIIRYVVVVAVLLLIFFHDVLTNALHTTQYNTHRHRLASLQAPHQNQLVQKKSVMKLVLSSM